MDSRFKPGQRLSETALSKELGVSRTPVREALKRLAENGFLKVVPRKGVFVNEIDSRRLEEILELRYPLEIYAAERGVERISQEELREMHAMVEECEAIVVRNGRPEYKRYIGIDSNIHRLIIRSSGNSLLVEFYETLAVFLQIARVRLSQSRRSMTRCHEEHKGILEAYEARDRDRLLQVLRSHMTRSKTSF